MNFEGLMNMEVVVTVAVPTGDQDEAVVVKGTVIGAPTSGGIVVETMLNDLYIPAPLMVATPRKNYHSLD